MEKRFYKLSVTKRTEGLAIHLKEPILHGKIIYKVAEFSTSGSHQIVVIEADDNQDQANLIIPGVEKISEDQAYQLAVQYQPERTMIKFNFLTGKEEEIKIPAFDLKKSLQEPDKERRKQVNYPYNFPPALLIR